MSLSKFVPSLFFSLFLFNQVLQPPCSDQEKKKIDSFPLKETQNLQLSLSMI